MNTKRSYTELKSINNFMDRFKYLKLDGNIGIDTFGHDRWINQNLYNSPEWKRVRRDVIVRDLGCDLGVVGMDIPDGLSIIVHHMNPITKNDILDNIEYVLDPEYLISTSSRTHEAIHYGRVDILDHDPVVRMKNDTKLW